MLKSQFDYLCETFGDPSLPLSERWKAIKYIYVENPIMDVQVLIKKGEIIYIDNEEIGAGFYILGTPNVELNPINEGYVISYIPLKVVDKITFVTTFIGSDNPNVSNTPNTSESIYKNNGKLGNIAKFVSEKIKPDSVSRVIE